jgi:hypothetical protein
VHYLEDYMGNKSFFSVAKTIVQFNSFGISNFQGINELTTEFSNASANL